MSLWRLLDTAGRTSRSSGVQVLLQQLCSPSSSPSSSPSCSSGRQQPADCSQLQQHRAYAAKKGGARGSAPTAAAAAPPPPKDKPADPYAPPEFRPRHVPRGSRPDPMSRLAPEQRELLQQLTPDGSPPRSLRSVGWPLGQREVLALAHEQLSQVASTNVAVVPFMLGDMFQSAAALAAVVAEYVAEGRGMPQVEQFLLTTIAGMPPEAISFEGLKVQIKGRLGGKGGKAAKRVWQWGRTSAASISDPVDYDHQAITGRAGHVGIKVWIRYKRSHMAEQALQSSRSPVSLAQLLEMPLPAALPSRSSSAWWNTPGPLQPQQHRAWECFRRGHDPLSQQQQQQQQQLGQSHAAGPEAA